MPIGVFQVAHERLAPRATSSIHAAANRGEERIAVDAIDVGIGEPPLDGSTDVTRTAAQVEDAQRLIACQRQRRRDQIEVSRLRLALLGLPEGEQLVQMSGDPGIDLILSDGRGLHSSVSGSAIAASIADNPSGRFGWKADMALTP
jgi:hypothetical protein